MQFCKNLNVCLVAAGAMLLASCSEEDNPVTPDPVPTDTHEAIDLGLPSGTKWAATNIGAATASEIGLYFAWGETVGYGGSADDGRTFYLDDYKWNTPGTYPLWYGFNKYQLPDGADGQNDNAASCWYDENGQFIGDGKTQLDDIDDAAVIHWGNGWRMPTNDEVIELCANCTSVWETMAGVKGVRMTSKINGNSIFLPAGGDRGSGEVHWVGEQGYYWTSTLEAQSTGFADMLYYTTTEDPHSHYARRFGGRTIRPVRR